MRKKIARAFEFSFIPVAILFLVPALLCELGIISVPTGYELLAYVLPAFAIPSLIRPAMAEKKVPGIPFILIALLLFALGIRLFPLIHSSVPLGYDPGFYKYTMDLYHSALPQIPEAGLADWVKRMYEQGLFVFSDAMYVVGGTTAIESIKFVFPLFGALVVLPLFVVTRHMFGPRVGLIACLLYTISYTQYTAFTMLYFKNVIGLILLLLAIYALEKKKDGLMALMFAGLGVFHRPEFLLFALILVPYFIMHRRRGIILAILGTALLISPFWIPRWELYQYVLTGAVGGGTLFGFDTYTSVSFAYLAFAIMGAVYLVINRSLNSVLFYFLITCIIVVFQVIFFRRFIIMLDLAVVMLAALGIERTLLQKSGTWRLAGATAAILVFVITGAPTTAEANDVRPLITQEQMRAVEWIRDNAESDAYVLATSSDAPWVLGWSARRVIAPGLFNWYLQSKDEWFDFIDSTDPEVARDFIDVYHSPVYVYYSKNPGNYLRLEKFQGPYFEEVYGDDRVVVYRYSGGI